MAFMSGVEGKSGFRTFDQKSRRDLMRLREDLPLLSTRRKAFPLPNSSVSVSRDLMRLQSSGYSVLVTGVESFLFPS